MNQVELIRDLMERTRNSATNQSLPVPSLVPRRSRETLGKRLANPKEAFKRYQVQEALQPVPSAGKHATAWCQMPVRVNQNVMNLNCGLV